MPTFANTIDNNEILAKRSQCDYAGQDIQTTYATKSEVTTGLASKQDTISDIDTIRSGAALGASAVQPSDLSTVAVSGDYDDLSNKPTIPAAQVNSDWNSSSGVSEILNKPTILPYKPVVAGTGISIINDTANNQIVVEADDTVLATQSELTTGLAAKQDTISDLATIRSGAAAGSTAVQPGDLATVASTGAYADLTGTPTIPTATSDLTNDSGFITLSDVPAQVNADWNAASGVAEILNKPTIPSATSDLQNDSGFITLSDVPAQAQADWTEADSTDPSYIQNKPSIPSATSDLTNDSGFITLSDVPAQQNADWNSSSGASEILNKPTIPSGVQLVPSATSADADKVLTVDSQGTPAWSTPAAGGVTDVEVDGVSVVNQGVAEITMPTVDQTYDGTSTNAQAGVAVASALSGKQDTLTAGSNITISSNTISATDTTYSAGTGIDITSNVISVETPVDIVAGPGIVIDNPDGNTLRVSTDENYETVLWEGSLALNNDTGTLSEAIENFQSVAIYAQSVYGGGLRKFVYTVNDQVPQYRFSTDSLDGASIYQVFFNLNITGTQVTISRSKKMTIQYSNNSITCADQTSPSSIISYVKKIVGIHRIAGGN